MFGRSKPVPFKPYALGPTKPARRMPRWLVWLLIGMVLGVAAVLFVQQKYLPPRLSAHESQQLQARLAQLDSALSQSQTQLAQANDTIRAQQAERERLAGELERAQAALQPLKNDLALLQEVLPPDPRGGELQIRAGRFYNRDEGLSYHLVLTREKGDKPFKGTVNFAVEGRYPNGRSATITLEPIALDMTRYENVQGVVPLPDGLHASQITTRILDGNERMQAMRVINSRN